MGDVSSRYAGPVEDDEFEDFADEDQEMSEEEAEKDATEEELERLVFGDKAGFREELGGFRKRAQLAEASDLEVEEEDEDEDNLATVNSADVSYTALQ